MRQCAHRAPKWLRRIPRRLHASLAVINLQEAAARGQGHPVHAERGCTGGSSSCVHVTVCPVHVRERTRVDGRHVIPVQSLREHGRPVGFGRGDRRWGTVGIRGRRLGGRARAHLVRSRRCYLGRNPSNRGLIVRVGIVLPFGIVHVTGLFRLLVLVGRIGISSGRWARRWDCDRCRARRRRQGPLVVRHPCCRAIDIAGREAVCRGTRLVPADRAAVRVVDRDRERRGYCNAIVGRLARERCHNPSAGCDAVVHHHRPARRRHLRGLL